VLLQLSLLVQLSLGDTADLVLERLVDVAADAFNDALLQAAGAAPAAGPRASVAAGPAGAFAAAFSSALPVASLMDTSLDGDAELPAGVADVDAEDAADPSCVSEYAREIYLHQKADEVRARDTSRRQTHLFRQSRP